MDFNKRVEIFLIILVTAVNLMSDDSLLIEKGKLYTQTLVNYPDAEKEAYIKTRMLQFNKTLPIAYSSDITFSKIYPNHYTIRGTYMLDISQKEVKKRKNLFGLIKNHFYSLIVIMPLHPIRNLFIISYNVLLINMRC